MSRSDYIEDMDDQWAHIRWRGAVESSIRGKRGQKLLTDLATAMDVMPHKELIAEELEVDGQYCALGVVGSARGVDMSGIDPDNHELVAKTFNIADALAREIVYMNDEYCSNCEPPGRWRRMRRWVEENIKTPLDIAE